MGGLIQVFAQLISLLAAFAGVVGVGYFILGAYKYMTASGSAQKVDEGKEAMKQSLMGIVLVLVAFTLVNTIISLVGDTTGGLRIDQLVGSDSSSLDGPQVVRVGAYGGSPGTKTTGVRIVFNEEVTVQNRDKIHIRSDRFGLGDTAITQPTGSEVSHINFQHPSIVRTKTCGSDAPALYTIEDLLLGSGASVRDSDGNPAIYAFPPTVVVFCRP